ncbi:MAG: response regulator [Alphaproteobacteria bacterium]|nr:response regulator [Alphaproteobacteria bacterium]
MGLQSLFFMLSVPVIGLLLLALFLQRRFCGLRNRHDGFLSALDVSDFGFVLFDASGRFAAANRFACEALPVLDGESSRISSVDDFFSYMFDHAVECDVGLKNVLKHVHSSVDDSGFREVVRGTKDRLYLVESRKSSDDSTAFIFTDVSHFRQREDHFLRLSYQNHQLYQAVEAATAGIVIFEKKDGLYKVVFANNALCRFLGVTRTEVWGRTPNQLFSVVCDVETERLISLAVDAGECREGIEISFESDEGALFCYELQISPVLENDANDIHLCIGVFTDRTELKRREAEAMRAQKMEALGQMAAGVAHDFNNLLSIVDGYTYQISSRLGKDNSVQDSLEAIRRASGRGAALVRQMLTFSRHKIISEDVINLVEAVREQEVLLRPLLDGTIDLTISCDDDVLAVECSADNVSQILMNFVVNARDAMPKGGKISVEVRKCDFQRIPQAFLKDGLASGGYVCMCVHDTGEGISPEVLEKIYDPFFTTKEHGKGTGLGLSMVYGLVQQMGGHIEVETAPGEGTRFSVFMPLSERMPRQAIVGDLSDVGSIQLTGYTILLAEDEDDLRRLISGMLERLGVTVLSAANGNEALLLQDEYEGRIDLLLTDVVMPELGGLELAELLTALRPEVKVILMSGYPASGQMARVNIPEQACFLAKPIQYDVLASLLYRCLKEGAAACGDPDFCRTCLASNGHWKMEVDDLEEQEAQV